MSGDFDYDGGSPAEGRKARSAKRRGGLGRIGRFFSALFTLAFVMAIAGAGVLFYLKTEFEAAGPIKADAPFAVISGQGLASIAESLESRGFITDSRIFILGVVANDAKSKLKAGEYLLPAGASMQKIMQALVSGKSVQHKVTIPEGLTSMQIVARLKEHPILVGEVSQVPAEGSLLPDTYVFLRGTTRDQLVERMRSAQEKAIEGLWAGRNPDLPIKSKAAALILASIVEKETGKADERPKVASVFINRLRKGMRLQSDPTIIYGIVGGKGVLDRPILKSDISKKTKYNTYQINGLPPTPIANPGFAAIKAVLNPAKTEELYFVADGTGGHAFARTLAGHNRNVAKWRKIEAKRRALEASKAALAGGSKKENEAEGSSEESTATAMLAPEGSKDALPPAPPPPPSLERSNGDSKTDTGAPAAELRGAAPDASPPPPPTVESIPKPDTAQKSTKQAKIDTDAAAVPEAVEKPVKRTGSIPIPRPKPIIQSTETAPASASAVQDNVEAAVPTPITPPASRPQRPRRQQPVRRNIPREPDR